MFDLSSNQTTPYTNSNNTENTNSRYYIKYYLNILQLMDMLMFVLQTINGSMFHLMYFFIEILRRYMDQAIFNVRIRQFVTIIIFVQQT